MKVKISEASGPVLDWMVATAEGLKTMKSGAGPSASLVYIPKGKRSYYTYQPTVNWKQGGPIIEREGIELRGKAPNCYASYPKHPTYHGPTPLIAAMRAFVASKLGEEVEVPDELA